MDRRCTSCGIVKPIEEFRPYAYNHEKHHTYCKECESIEMRRRHLLKHAPQSEELTNIEKLYDKRQAAGLSVPGRKRARSTSVASLVDKYLKEDL